MQDSSKKVIHSNQVLIHYLNKGQLSQVKKQECNQSPWTNPSRIDMMLSYMAMVLQIVSIIIQVNLFGT